MTVTIYHNPRCSKSRATLQALKDNGIDATVVEYLLEPPTAEELKDILGMLGMSPRQLLRKKEATAAGLDNPDLGDDELIAAMVANPIVIERPIVVAGGKAKIGRPPEAVLDIIQNP